MGTAIHFNHGGVPCPIPPLPFFVGPDVQNLTGFSCTTIYRLMRAQEFPEPIRIGGRAVRWRRSDIDEWLAARPRATGDGPRGATV